MTDSPWASSPSFGGPSPSPPSPSPARCGLAGGSLSGRAPREAAGFQHRCFAQQQPRYPGAVGTGLWVQLFKRTICAAARSTHNRQDQSPRVRCHPISLLQLSPWSLRQHRWQVAPCTVLVSKFIRDSAAALRQKDFAFRIQKANLPAIAERHSASLQLPQQFGPGVGRVQVGAKGLYLYRVCIAVP
jgi:hypothetical protein